LYKLLLQQNSLNPNVEKGGTHFQRDETQDKNWIGPDGKEYGRRAV